MAPERIAERAAVPPNPAHRSRSGAILACVRSFASAALAVPLVATAACSYYDSSLLEPRVRDAGGSQPAGDASTESHDAPASDTPAGSCKHRTPPDPPSVKNAGGSIELVVAMSSIDFGDSSSDAGMSYRSMGYDLDVKCTCQGEGPSCQEAAWATADSCDGPEGQDNSGGGLVAEMTAFVPESGTAKWNADIQSGKWSVLLRVRGYNGQADDDQVEVAWYVPGPLGGLSSGDAGNARPVWDGNDVWPVRSQCLEPANGDAGTYDVNAPRYVDAKGYVTGSVLVASVPKGTMRITDQFSLLLTGAFLTATVGKNQQGLWELRDGTLAARWMLSDILGQLAGVQDPVLSQPLCTNSLFYPNIKKKICAYADIYSSVGTPTTECDSTTLGARFQALQAKLGGVLHIPPEPSKCSGQNDPGKDSCAK
jgi:hypothetical protein